MDQERTRVSMAEAPEAAFDIFEKIFLGFEMKHLIPLKMVCKSWHSFISSSRFVESHLNRSYNNNSKCGYPRIVISASQACYKCIYNRNVTKYSGINAACILGSCNGLILICILESLVYLVNPMTTEVKNLQIPQVPDVFRLRLSKLCWGFGYDSSTDEYKVILGFAKDEKSTCFQMLGLKSNVWKDIGEVNYTIIITSFGVLCNGELYWFMTDQNNARVILSFHISKEEFEEIAKPDNAGYDWGSCSLGLSGESLCIYHPSRPGYEQWVMKKYGKKIHWEFLPQVCGNDLKSHKGYIAHKLTFGHVDISLSTTSRNIGAPIFVPSLVSPHVNGTLKKKWQAMNIIMIGIGNGRLF